MPWILRNKHTLGKISLGLIVLSWFVLFPVYLLLLDSKSFFTLLIPVIPFLFGFFGILVLLGVKSDDGLQTRYVHVKTGRGSPFVEPIPDSTYQLDGLEFGTFVHKDADGAFRIDLPVGWVQENNESLYCAQTDEQGEKRQIGAMVLKMPDGLPTEWDLRQDATLRFRQVMRSVGAEDHVISVKQIAAGVAGYVYRATLIKPDETVGYGQVLYRGWSDDTITLILMFDFTFDVHFFDPIWSRAFATLFIES